MKEVIPLHTGRLIGIHILAYRIPIELGRISSPFFTANDQGFGHQESLKLGSQSPFFNRKYIFNPGPFSIAMLVYQSV